MRHSDRPATRPQARLLKSLANERGSTYTVEDIHCRTCASTAIDALIAKPRDRTDYRPSTLKAQREAQIAQRRGE